MDSALTQLHSESLPTSETEPVVTRRLRVTDRALLQLATSVVRGDPIRSLVELIANSDDSFRRMEYLNETSYGRILVSLDYERNAITVLDFAEGMGSKIMDECVGTYGAEVSGFNRGCPVRGFYGRGLKEAILGLGSGKIVSMRDGFFHECSLSEDGLYVRRERRRASLSDYLDLGIPCNRNGTKIVIQLTKVKKLPRFEWIKHNLSNHVSLRDIMQSPRRRVILTDGQRSEILNYKPPRGKLVLRARAIPIPGLEATLDVTVYKSDRPLNQEGYTRDGGLLIKSRNAIHDATLFKFDYDPYAASLFGEVRCDYIEELMAKGELVVGDKRDGLDSHHPFTKALRKVVEAELQPLVEQDVDQQQDESKVMSNDLRRRFDTVLWEVNRLAIRLMRNSMRYGKPPASPGRDGASDSPKSPRNEGTELSERVEIPLSQLLFKGIKLNPRQDPRVRVYLDNATGIINIATRAPSVAMYYDQPQENGEFLTLIAELISDSVCFELASLMSSNGKPDLMPEIFTSLKNKYSHLVHRTMREGTEEKETLPSLLHAGNA